MTKVGFIRVTCLLSGPTPFKFKILNQELTKELNFQIFKLAPLALTDIRRQLVAVSVFQFP